MMLTLRLDQAAEPGGGHRIEASLTGPGLVPQRASVRTAFAMSRADHERVRWYLEDFLEYPVPPAPAVAKEVEGRLAELGRELFRAVFGEGDGLRLWARLQGELPRTRVEIAASVGDATALPWELLRDPATDTAVALEAAAFVRVSHGTARPVDPRSIPDGDGGPLRILLVICRPAGGSDVPFRSVANHMVRLGGEAGRDLRLDVLRPPTFGQLSTALDRAHRDGRPYHVVHFDGHGTYLDSESAAGHHFVSPARAGRHGYLLFEDATAPSNEQLVDGPALGGLLARTGVGVLVLNACRSAYSEARERPGDESATDVHGRIRGYGSLALEVTDAGVPGVVAMRYSVYVATAARFVADLYRSILDGLSLGDAVTAGRRQLAAQPNRAIALDPLPLQDWTVPVVYESVPLTLFRAAPDRAGLPPVDRKLEGLPRPPDVGFFGRDETLLALDRAFDRHAVVLLHAYAGAGKTTTAAEFARWYTATGGLSGNESRQGLVLFSSLERYTPLPHLLNQLADRVRPLLEASDIHWQALDEDDRRRVALSVLDRGPVLWIWDNVEPVAGFPQPTDSPWPAAEQRELADFLRDLSRTGAKVLLTSRRDERRWLGDLPRRVRLPPMPMRERIQLTRALAERYGHRIGDVQDWRPLLRYTAGNPLTVTVLVGQALRQRLTGRSQIEALVDRLRAGEGEVEDDESQGRSRSLGASLSYGLEAAFTGAERAQLAVLHLFRETASLAALTLMASPDFPGHPPELDGLTAATGTALLDRAAEVGLLTPIAAGYYAIHPALPWYLRRLRGPAEGDTAQVAYVAAMGAVGSFFMAELDHGRHGVLALARLDEANLLHARRLGRRLGRWDDAVGCMQALNKLYEHLGRGAEWARLVDELVPDLTDPGTGGPYPGREVAWEIVLLYQLDIAFDARDWDRSERLVRVLSDWPRTGEPHDERDLRQAAILGQRMGLILFQRGDPRCVEQYERALAAHERAGNQTAVAAMALYLGHAFKDVDGIRDLDRAEQWYRRSLDLRGGADRVGRSQALGQLGLVAWDRFREARASGAPEPVAAGHLAEAMDLYRRALAELPRDAVLDIAKAENQLATVYFSAGDIGAALDHLQRAITRFENAGLRLGAGGGRLNVALVLRAAGRPADALLYARAALADFRSVPDTAGHVADAERLVAILSREVV